MDMRDLTNLIKQEAERLGFDRVGISKAGLLEEEAKDLEAYLKLGMHGSMAWMENHFDLRVDPRNLVEDACTVISVIHNYFPSPYDSQIPDAPKISKYAWGEDYHTILKRKLYLLLDYIQSIGGQCNARVFTDSAPVMDKVWAKKSGLGWQGKHTNLIHPKLGSFFFIGEIILDLELEPDGPITDHCGTCTRCIDACPTQALEPYKIDSNKCISYLTIELRDKMPEEFKGKTENWAYGCDICMDVCPWNRFATPHPGGEFKPLDGLLSMGKADWEALGEKEFRKLTRRSAMSRVKYDKFVDTLAWLDNAAPLEPGE